MADELVTLATYFDPIAAAMAKNALEVAGIRATLSGDHTHLFPGIAGGFGTIRVLVFQSDFDRAVEALSEPEPLPEEGEMEPPPEEIQSAERIHGMQGTSSVTQEEVPTSVTATMPKSEASILEKLEPGQSVPLPQSAVSDEADLANRFRAPEARFLRSLSSWVFVVLLVLGFAAVAALAMFR